MDEKSESPPPLAAKANEDAAPDKTIEPPGTPAPTSPAPQKSPSSFATGNGQRDTPSIFGGLQQKTNTAKQSVSRRNEPFDEQMLLDAWKRFGARLHAEGSGEVEKLVMSREVAKVGDSDIQIRLVSELERTVLEQFEMNLMQFLRQELKNDHLLLQKVMTAKKTGQQLYTSQDIYQFMARQNPKLEELKQRLGLDFEY